MSGTRPLAACADRCADRVPPAEADGPYLGLEHVRPGALFADPPDEAPDLRSHVLRYRPGDVLFGRLRPYFRKVLMAGAAGVCSPEMWVFRAREGIHPAWLFYTLASPAFVDAATRAADGTRMPRARWNALADWPVTVPPLEVQARLAGRLALFDRRVAAHRRAVNLAQRLLLATWRGRATGTRPLGEIAEAVRETVTEVPPGTPLVGLADVPRGSFGLDAWTPVDEVAGPITRFRRGDVLFGRLRPYLRKVVVAPVDGVCTPEILVLRPREPRWYGPLLAAAVDPALADFATRAATGTRMPRAKWSALAGWPTPVPASPEAFTALARPLAERTATAMGEVRRLLTLRDAVLARTPGLGG